MTNSNFVLIKREDGWLWFAEVTQSYVICLNPFLRPEDVEDYFSVNEMLALDHIK